MRKEKAQFGKLWIALAFIAILFAFASASLTDYLMTQEALEVGFASPAEFPDPYHMILLYGSPLCLIGLVGFIVGMASKERSIQMISSFFALFGAVIPYVAGWYKAANAADLVPPAITFDFGNNGAFLQTISMLMAFVALIGFLLFLIASLIRFKKGKGTLVLRIIGLVLFLGIAASSISSVIIAGSPIENLFLQLDGISLVLKILTVAMFGAALLALRSVKSEAHEVEEPSLAKGSEELPEQEEDLPVGEEEIIPAEACGKE